MITPSLTFILYLAGLATVILCLTQIALLIQRRRSDIDKKKDRHGTSYRNYPHSNQKYPEHIAIAASIHYLRQQFETYQKEQTNAESRKECRDYVTICALALTALVAFGSDWIFYDQLYEMRTEGRAWVIPQDAKIAVPASTNAPFKPDIFYQNVGKEPARNFTMSILEFPFTISDWNNGTAARFIDYNASKCLKTNSIKTSSTSYPSISPSNYTIHSKFSGMTNMTAEQNSSLISSIIKGEQILAIIGCFTYRSIDKDRHSSFCYFYDASITDVAHLNICTVGSDAD